MKLYTTTGTVKLRERCNELNVSLMMCNHWRNPNQWPYFAIDNGCYSAYAQGKEWDPTDFIKILYRCKHLGLKPDFVVIPDIVAGGDLSLEKSERWGKLLKEEFPDWKFYLAVQDGMKISDIAYSPLFTEWVISGLFVGGTMDWKMKYIDYWSKFAKKWHLEIHVGRIGPLDSMMKCNDCGIDSIDSTSWVQNKGWMETRVAEFRRRVE